MSASLAQIAADRRKRDDESWRENSPNKPIFGPAAGPGRTERFVKPMRKRRFEECLIGPQDAGEFVEVGDGFAKTGLANSRALPATWRRRGTGPREPPGEVMSGWPGHARRARFAPATRRNAMRGGGPKSPRTKPILEPAAGQDAAADIRAQIVMEKPDEEEAIGPPAVGGFAKVDDGFAKVGGEFADVVCDR